MRMATRFASRSPVLRADYPLSDASIREVAPSIFAPAKHESRSARYTYVPTGDVLAGLRKEGFEPFMVCQSRTRDQSRREYTKHMLRLRHAGAIDNGEAQEIILVNSHDGTSSYQMIGGVFRFVCKNGLVVGDQVQEIRVPHKGDIIGRVIEGAYTILDNFETVAASMDSMKATQLTGEHEEAFARAALALRYEPTAHVPIDASQLIEPRRLADREHSLWTTFNRVQENLVQGGRSGTTAAGRRTTTRAVNGIDQNIALNRALWTLAEEMRRLVH